MAVEVPSESQAAAEGAAPHARPRTRRILTRLGSLRITVVLFAVAIFLIFAGTMAQTQMDVWDATNAYFRCWVAKVELQVFFPPSFFPSRPQVPGWFPFPGGRLIGLLLLVNLAAASVVRFPIAARGKRLAIGLAVTLLGALAVWVVVASGASERGLHYSNVLDWSFVWWLFLASLAAAWLASVGATLAAIVRRRAEPDRPEPDRPESHHAAGRRARRLLVGALGGEFLVGVLLGWLALQGEAARLSDSNMRILWQLMTATAAALVLQAGCTLLFKRKGALVVVHVGIVLMMLGELLVGYLATEAHMTIAEGQTVNFVEQTRTSELAVVDASDPREDEVVVVPQSMLRPGAVLSHQYLPFDFEVVEYFRNSKLRDVPPGDEADHPADNPATAGIGRREGIVAVAARASTGTESRVDFPSAYIRVDDEGGPARVYLLSRYLRDPQPITVDGRTYQVSLRAKRSYKPYSIRLIDARRDDYVGTTTPKNYSSEIRLTDPTRGVDRELKIWMNNPLRFAGETFYQSNFYRDPRTGAEVTGLAVVSNSNWMIPYVGCMVVAVGLLVQFGSGLVRFAGGPSQGPTESAEDGHAVGLEAGPRPRAVRPASVWASRVGVGLPVLAVAAAIAFFVVLGHQPETAEDGMSLAAFGRLPVAYQGRVKPLDTLARNSLRIVSDRETFRDADGRKQPAVRWLLDVIAKPDAGFDHRVFRIRNEQLLYALGLERRPGHRYALDEFRDKLTTVAEEAARVRDKAAEDTDRYEKKLLELERKLGLVELIVQAFSVPEIRTDQAQQDLMASLRKEQRLGERQPPLVVPAGQEAGEDLQAVGGAWQTLGMAWTLHLVGRLAHGEGNPAVESISRILDAYADGNAPEFNREVAEYQRFLRANRPEQYEGGRIAFEAFFNRAQWFFGAWVLYIAAFLIACLALLFWFWRKPIGRTAFWLLVLVFVVHTLALAGRVAISGRPPVTNLYSSALFIGWAGVLIGLVIQAIYRLGIGNLVASVAGVATLQIAWQLAGDGDTFKVMQAVLDTNFWLTTHVLTIALGYAATFVAGLLGMLCIGTGVFTPALDRRLERTTARMIYGVLCFALFFSFIGTVLGGLWADDSWGRFWGWDPKENGALIIVLWNALVLHARWGGMIRERGLAVLAVGGNICTAWSWFGVNELGVGLHSYGFTEGVLLKLALFVAVQILVIALGLMPLSWWWSYRRRGEGRGSPTAASL